MTVLTLPYPLSVNRYWMPVKMKSHLAILPTKEGRKYREQAAALCIAQGARKIAGRVKIELWLYPNRPLDWQKRIRQHGAAWDDTVQCQDLDNANKVVLDALKDILIEDDKWVRQLLSQRMEPDDKGARVVVRITPLTVENKQEVLL